MSTRNAIAAGCAAGVLAAIVGATVNIRALIATELSESTAATAAQLKQAVADIRRDIRAGRESSEREMAGIRRLLSNQPRGTDDGRRADVRH